MESNQTTAAASFYYSCVGTSVVYLMEPLFEKTRTNLQQKKLINHLSFKPEHDSWQWLRALYMALASAGAYNRNKQGN